MRLDARVREADEAHRRLEPELGGNWLGGEQAGRGPVGQPCRVAGGDAASGAERRLQLGKAGGRRVRPKELIAVCHLPAFVGEDGHRNDRARHHSVRLGPGRRGLGLRAGGKCVGCGSSQMWELVVQVLRRLSHHGSALIDQALAHEAWVEVDLVAHRVVTHVLDAADEDEVGRTHGDLARSGRGRRQRPCAHAVDGKAGHGVRQAGEERHAAAERQALVAHLRRRGENHVADALGRDRRVAAQQLAHDLHRQIVGAGLPEPSAGARLAERGADAVDEHHLAQLACHGAEDSH